MPSPTDLRSVLSLFKAYSVVLVYPSFMVAAGKSRAQKVGQASNPGSDPYGRKNRLLLRFRLRFGRINLSDK